jgi:hypothetical protein
VELATKVGEIKLFENLHNEKPSPLFLNLIKRKNCDSLSGIRAGNGSVRHFEKIYVRDKKLSNFNFENCIENFLGPDLLQHPVVQGFKITATERERLDRPLTLLELDNSVKNANKKSAPGIDGYSNKLILACWEFLRRPLLNYANYCFISGKLTHNFRSACIRLISKKGNLSDINNWRPISLLSNMYKIISRAINERLKGIVNRIRSRAQKGYNDKRYAQEVLINVCETISYCRKNSIRGAVLAVDMAKAFDTLDHGFIQQVYKFFGFGHNIIKWLTLLGNEREACIILDETKNSRYFKLGTGRPQGDNLSPFTFNFCEQICILKLELDPLILKIDRPNPYFLNVAAPFQCEANRETGKNESLADDSTVLTIIEKNSLTQVKNILDRFADISGLKCNYDKTCLLPIHPLTEVENEMVAGTGFTVVNHFKLLGANITADVNDLKENFSNVITKITGQISFWSRFRLSLPGRITIAKTYLISQINYLGCVFRPSDEQIAVMQRIINSFIKKGLNISDERMYADPESGGLGFFNISNFLDAQMCTWILRAKNMPIDNWRYDLNFLAPGRDPLALRTSDVNREEHPILFEFVNAYERFYYKFCKKDDNVGMSLIFKNPLFRDPESGEPLDQTFFGNKFYNNNLVTLRNLKFRDCFNGNTVKNLDDFAVSGLRFSFATWWRLRGALLNTKDRYRSINLTAPDTGSIWTFTRNWKRGSKK